MVVVLCMHNFCFVFIFIQKYSNILVKMGLAESKGRASRSCQVEITSRAVKFRTFYVNLSYHPNKKTHPVFEGLPMTAVGFAPQEPFWKLSQLPHSRPTKLLDETDSRKSSWERSWLQAPIQTKIANLLPAANANIVLLRKLYFCYDALGRGWEFWY